MSSTDPTVADRTTVEFPASEGFRSVGRLVLGGIASRFELPVDRVDDLVLAVESLLMQDPVGDTIRLQTEATPTGLLVRLGSFSSERLSDPALQRVLARLVDEVTEQPDGDGAAVELVVNAAYRGPEA